MINPITVAIFLFAVFDAALFGVFLHRFVLGAYHFDQKAMIITTLFLIPFLGVALNTTWQAAVPIGEGLPRLDWRTVQGEVLSSAFIDSPERVSVQVNYRYVVDDRSYQGSALVRDVPDWRIEDFNPGSEIEVYHHPDEFERSALEGRPQSARTLGRSIFQLVIVSFVLSIGMSLFIPLVIDASKMLREQHRSKGQ
ncbi:MAG: DUF3592 domain-containing protein [Chloroflexi bacterium]|nr:DUF3592 domain-containing protein [Chloroflexota bacterium]